MTNILLWFKIIWAALTSRSNQTFYDKISTIYDDVYTDHEIHARTIIGVLNEIYAGRQKNTLILDLGCGTGMLTKMLSQEGYKVIGMDISFSSLCVHQDKYPTHKLIQADANFLPIAENTLHSVVCLGVWRHFPDVEKVLDEVARVLTKDGTFIVGYFPPAMAGSIDLNQTWWGKLLIRFYQLTTKTLGYIDRADFSLEEETLELAKQKFNKLDKIESSSNKYLLYAQSPFNTIDKKTQDLETVDVDKIFRCPYCIATNERTGYLKLIQNKWLVCQEPQCSRKYKIHNGIPLLNLEQSEKETNTQINDLP